MSNAISTIAAYVGHTATAVTAAALSVASGQPGLIMDAANHGAMVNHWDDWADSDDDQGDDDTAESDD